MSLYLGSEKVENVTAQITLPVEPSNDLPLADGTASASVSKKFSRADHVHPAQENSMLLGNIDVTMPTSADWRSICYGDGKFVAIAWDDSSNVAAYSTDGINWTQTTMPSKALWKSVCYGNGKFVAVSGGVTYNSNIAAYSTDGINWTQTTMPGSRQWLSVCYGNGKFIAVCCNSTQSAYSTDGINWSNGKLPIIDDWHSVCYGNDKFVIVSGDDAHAAYSTDGINWTQATMPSDAKWYSVCYGNGKFVAVARQLTAHTSESTNAAAYSTDGINWTQTTLPAIGAWESVCYGNDKFVAVMNSLSSSKPSIAAYSTDGINWTQTALFDCGNFHGSLSVCYGDSKFVTVIGDDTNVAYSTDGINWNSTTKGLQLPNGTDIHEQVKNALQITASDVNAIPSTLSGTAGQVLTKTASGQEWKDAASPQPSTTTPLAPTKAGSIGASDAYARGDHVHPSEMITLTGNMYEGNDGVTTEATYTSIKSLLTKYKIIQFELNYHESTNDKKLFFNTIYTNGNPEQIIFSGAEKGGNDNYNCLNFIIFSSASSTVEFKSYSTMTEDGLRYFYKPTARKVTLTTSGWSNNQQTVTCTGVSSSATSQEIRVMPADASKTSAYVSCGVSCVAQASDSLTFACDKVPTTAIDVYVVMQFLNFQG